ncbi:uncharacterized protein METZ01_LOCUS189172, partial [marine metagenome]
YLAKSNREPVSLVYIRRTRRPRQSSISGKNKKPIG